MRTDEETALLARFAKQYKHSQAEAFLEIERTVCGCDYGGTSWTTKDEAHLIARLLELAPGKHFLDIGAGSGWPGLYLARITGCGSALVDIPVEGLEIAAHRAVLDELSGACWSVAAEGALLPFGSGFFDAIGHSDVLCCLDEKQSVLAECRRVTRSSGKMVFTVISIAAGLSPVDRKRAAGAGPPFKAVTTEYPAMLLQTGWTLVEHRDLTSVYACSVRSMIKEEEARRDLLTELLGEDELAQIMLRRKTAAAAIDDGLLTRELFAAVPM